MKQEMSSDADQTSRVMIVTSTLPLIHGGRTKSLLSRARMFRDHGVNVSIYTTNYNPNYQEVYDSFIRRGLVYPETKLNNIYDYYRNDKCEKTENNYQDYLNQQFPGWEQLPHFKKYEHSGVTYYYKAGSPLLHISRTVDGKIKNIDLYSPYFYSSYCRIYLDSQQNIHKIRYFESGNQAIVLRDVFLNNSLEEYLIKEFIDFAQKPAESRFILLQSEPRVFNTEKTFFANWFNDLFCDGDIVINDARLLDAPLLDTQKKMKKIFQLHSSHLANPADPASGIKGSYKLILATKDPSSRIITLSEKQKINIQEKVPAMVDRLSVIPHFKQEYKLEFTVNPHKICMISRLSIEKNLDECIRGMSLFHQLYPEYSLDIYGEGEQWAHLNELIQELHLEQVVHLRGYTEKPWEIYQKCAFSLITSNYEGFALSVLESISNGCPVISYQINWGPDEILDEDSGRITQQNTPEALCEAMVEEVRKPLDRTKTRERSKIFSKEVIWDKWCKLIF